MLSEVQQRKLTRLFNLLDTDHDGVISQADYRQRIDRLSGGHAAGSAEHEAVERGHMNDWQRTRAFADQNRDQQVVLPEFLAANEALLSDRQEFAAHGGTLIAITVGLVDGGDGPIGADGYASSLGEFGVGEEEARAAFVRLDRSGDGRLSRDELRQAVDEFFFSTDPEAPGNWLLGTF
ncbi:MAG TPA: EF-hand domain-containing protein [Herpetosiphonaceae bacterium]|nr:EF-hand domain-containing protein [Herpetosiphonaceae bacterium]